MSNNQKCKLIQNADTNTRTVGGTVRRRMNERGELHTKQSSQFVAQSKEKKRESSIETTAIEYLKQNREAIQYIVQIKKQTQVTSEHQTHESRCKYTKYELQKQKQHDTNKLTNKTNKNIHLRIRFIQSRNILLLNNAIQIECKDQNKTMRRSK